MRSPISQLPPQQKRFSLITLILLLTSLLHPGAAASDKLLVGIDQDFPPFTYIKEDGHHGGLFVEILTASLQAAGIEYKIIGYPWKRLVLLTDNETLDLAIPFRHKPERFEKYHMVGPFTPTGSRTFLFGRRDTKIRWEKMSDLNGLVIGLIDGFAYPESIEQAVHLNYHRVNGPTRNIMMMLHLERLDLLVSDETVFWDTVKNTELSTAFTPVGAPLEQVMRYIAVPRSKQGVANLMRDVLEKFKKTSGYRDILTRYRLAP